MKLALLKIGYSINDSQNLFLKTEIKNIIKILQYSGDEVHYFTRIEKTRATPLVDNETKELIGVRRDIEDFMNVDAEENFDAMLVVNGSTDCYGGGENRHNMLNYMWINKFNKPIFYIFIDGMFFLKNIWEDMDIKQTKYPHYWKNKYIKEDIYVEKKVHYISGFRNLDFVRNEVETMNNYVKMDKLIHYEFYKNVLMMYNGRRFSEQEISDCYDNKTVDVIYGGGNRAGRNKHIIKFFFDLGTDVRAEVFGKVDEKNFARVKCTTRPTFNEVYFDYEQYIEYMMKSLSSITIGDNNYKGNTFTQRTLDSIISNQVSFIELEFDPNRNFYNHPFLKDFNYVSDRNELRDKILMLKNDKALFMKIIKLQHKEAYLTKEQKHKLYVEFHDIIKNNI